MHAALISDQTERSSAKYQSSQVFRRFRESPTPQTPSPLRRRGGVVTIWLPSPSQGGGAGGGASSDATIASFVVSGTNRRGGVRSDAENGVTGAEWPPSR